MASSGTGTPVGGIVNQYKKGERDALILDVMPKEAETDVSKLKNCIKNCQINGVRWTEEMKEEEVVRGVNKVRVQAILEKEMDTSEVQDCLLGLKDDSGKPVVGSVEFIAFGKHPF